MRTTTSLVGLLDMSIATVRRQFYDSDIGPAAAASLSFTRLCGPRPVRSVDTSYPYVGRDERTSRFYRLFRWLCAMGQIARVDSAAQSEIPAS
jgi:hypothetical protein